MRFGRSERDNAGGKGMKTLAGPQGINWQEKYLRQIDARLEGLERAFAQLRAEFLRLDNKIEAYGDRLDKKIEAQGNRLDAKVDAGFARLDDKIDRGLRELRRLQWGTLILVATATLGSLVRSLM